VQRLIQVLESGVSPLNPCDQRPTIGNDPGDPAGSVRLHWRFPSLNPRVFACWASYLFGVPPLEAMSGFPHSTQNIAPGTFMWPLGQDPGIACEVRGLVDVGISAPQN
jgi:hypothetical protein